MSRFQTFLSGVTSFRVQKIDKKRLKTGSPWNVSVFCGKTRPCFQAPGLENQRNLCHGIPRKFHFAEFWKQKCFSKFTNKCIELFFRKHQRGVECVSWGNHWRMVFVSQFENKNHANAFPILPQNWFKFVDFQKCVSFSRDVLQVVNNKHHYYRVQIRSILARFREKTRKPLGFLSKMDHMTVQ